MTPAPSEADRPVFPKAALVVGLVALILVALGSIGINYFIGERIRTIGQAQDRVQVASERVGVAYTEMDRRLGRAIGTGTPSDRLAYERSASALRPALGELEAAIQLDSNRAAFANLVDTLGVIRAADAAILDLAAAGRTAEAADRLAATDQYALREGFAQNLSDIRARSRAHVASQREQIDTILDANLVGSIVAVLLLVLAWFLIGKPARLWAKQLARMEREASALAAAKADFLAVMSHEIRTPLNGVIGFADLLLLDEELNEEQRHRVEIISSAGAMLLSIVNEVLDQSKMEAGMMELAEADFALETLVDNCVSVVRPAAAAQGLSLPAIVDPACADFYRGDEGRIRQILLNLLNNAVKFTASGSVTIRAAPHGGQLRFTVSDTGKGIAQGDLERLFAPYTQADASIARDYGGTGLGLSISRRLADLMGGSIHVASTLGKGSTFTLDLPLAEGAAPEQAALANTDMRPASILLVEDVPMNQEMAATLLRAMGHKVTIADDGLAALDAARAHRFDCILMDIQMPGMDGVTAARAIRSLPAPHGDVPIVALTANSLPEQLATYRRAGMGAHVAKPIKRDALTAALAAILGNEDCAPNPTPDPQTTPFDREAFDRVVDLLGRDKVDAYLADLATLARRTLEAAPDERASLAHNLASQAGMLGLYRLSDTARALENGTPGDEGLYRSFLEATADLERAESGSLAA
ncbi:ATP-binding protein [Sphingomicrobium sp. XHP0235]|uniref:hybrid sensor histidine kinase/response regulator n=1 Tax=Sphingomicrobium aquimarinum TaxID=3133971 RepID=UPI0031FE4C83